MFGKARKAVLSIFVIATIALTATMLTSFYEYAGIFRAVRTLRLTVSDFKFTILDSTNAVAETILNVNNTSSHQFVAVDFQQRIEVNDFYVGTSRKEGVSATEPLHVSPGANYNLSLALDLNLVLLETARPGLVELLLEPSASKTWLIYVDAFLEGPLIGRFTMATWRQVSSPGEA